MSQLHWERYVISCTIQVTMAPGPLRLGRELPLMTHWQARTAELPARPPGTDRDTDSHNVTAPGPGLGLRVGSVIIIMILRPLASAAAAPLRSCATQAQCHIWPGNPSPSLYSIVCHWQAYIRYMSDIMIFQILTYVRYIPGIYPGLHAWAKS
jgi:hypothetical protein